MEQTVSRFLRLLRVPVSDKYFRKIMASHPDFPSLLSISDTLQRLGVKHRVRRIEVSDLEKLPYPYLLPLNKNGSDILLIKDKNDLNLQRQGLEHWGGVVLQGR